MKSIPRIYLFDGVDARGEWASVADDIACRAAFDRYWNYVSLRMSEFCGLTTKRVVERRCACVPQNRKDLLRMYVEIMARQCMNRRLA